MKDFWQEDTPTTRLGRIGEAALDAVMAHPEYDENEDRIILMLSDELLGGIALRGYEHTRDAVSDLMEHVTAVCAAAGLGVQIIPMPHPPGQG